MRFTLRGGLLSPPKIVDVEADGVRCSIGKKSTRMFYKSVASVHWSEIQPRGFRAQALYLRDANGNEISISGSNFPGASENGAGFLEVVIEVLERMDAAGSGRRIILGYPAHVRTRTFWLTLLLFAVVSVFQHLTSKTDIAVHIGIFVIALVSLVVVIIRQGGGLKPKTTTARQLADALSQIR